MTQYTYMLITPTGQAQQLYGDEAPMIALRGRGRLFRTVGTFYSHTIEEWDGTLWMSVPVGSLPQNGDDGPDDPRVKELTTKIQALLDNKFSGSTETAFAHYDKGNNGTLSYEEVIDVLRDADVGNRFTRGMWASGIIDKLDTDKDGCISKVEFFSVLKETP